MPRNIKEMTREEENEIYKRFFKGFNQTRDRPEVIEVLQDIEQYSKELKALNITDDEVNVKINFVQIIGNFIYTIPFVLFNLAFVSIIEI